MVEPLSPLDPIYRRGRVSDQNGACGFTLAETQPGSIVQIATWPGEEAVLRTTLRDVLGLDLDDTAGAGAIDGGRAAFCFAPGRFLVVDQTEGLAERLRSEIGIESGTVTDLSHGRTALSIAGERSRWVLAKLFAIDFSHDAFPVGSARATSHHDVFALIQRTGASRFDIYVYRSFARAFWLHLCEAAREVGYAID